MSAKEQIAKLEALLTRVSSRANEPRVAGAHAHAHAPTAAAPVAAPAPVPVAAPAPTPAPAPVAVAVATPPIRVSEPEVDVAREAIEIPVAAKSDARLIAVKAVEPFDLDAPVDSSATLTDAPRESIPVEEVAAELEVVEEDDVEDVEESAPSSSRRPIAPPPAEEIAETAFGAEDLAEPPRHTPPPESGRLPAAPELSPVIDAGDEDEVEVITGVHHTPANERATPDKEPDALARSGEHEGLSSPPDEVTPAPAVSRVELTPHVARPERTASAAVADTLGQAMAFSPATFGELLDATLSL